MTYEEVTARAAVEQLRLTMALLQAIVGNKPSEMWMAEQAARVEAMEQLVEDAVCELGRGE